MPMMFGFSAQRRQMLEAELVRVAEELPVYGSLRMHVVGDFARDEVRLDTPLELVIVHPTDEPYRRRADFFVDHLRPRLDIRFHVYTPEEFEQLADEDPLLIDAIALGEPVFGE